MTDLLIGAALVLCAVALRRRQRREAERKRWGRRPDTSTWFV